VLACNLLRVEHADQSGLHSLADGDISGGDAEDRADEQAIAGGGGMPKTRADLKTAV